MGQQETTNWIEKKKTKTLVIATPYTQIPQKKHQYKK